MNNHSSQFSKLFLNNATSYKLFELRKNLGSSPEHPFSKIEYYISSKLEEDHNWNFERDFKYFRNMKEAISSSFDQFQFEYSLLLRNRAKYLNEVVRNLITYLEIIEDTLLDGTVGSSPNESRQGLITLIKRVLKEIFIQHHLELNNSHHTVLSKWFHLKKPIRSFQWRHFPDNKQIWDLYKTYLVEPGFISPNSYQTFKSLFENKVLEDKITWWGSKSSLYLFIRLLLKHDLIRNTKRKHWIITSEYFLLKGETLTPEDFHNQKETQNKEHRKALEYFVSHLIQ